jgi:hypothetical protein
MKGGQEGGREGGRGGGVRYGASECAGLIGVDRDKAE